MTKSKSTKASPAVVAKLKDAKQASKTAPKAEKKTDKLIALLQRQGGASVVTITEATGWLPHSARAMLTGLRKKGFMLDKAKVDGTIHYAITAEPSA